MAMQYFPNAQNQNLESMGLEGINASLKELVCSNHSTAPITCGIFTMAAGKPLEYTYTYDEFKIMLEGEMTLTEEGKEPVNLKPGDVVFFDAGTKITFTSNTSGKVFYVAQRKLGEL